MPVQAEVYANQPTGTVTSGGTTTSDTAFTVTTVNNFPVASTTPTPSTVFRIMDPALPTEIMLVTVSSNGTGQSWTVARAQEGTSAVAHASNWTCVQIITEGSLNQFRQNELLGSSSLVTANDTATPSTIFSVTPSPQNQPVAGVVYEFVAFGTLSSYATASTTGEIIFTIKWNGTTLAVMQADSNEPGLGTSIASGGWWLEGCVVCLSATSMVAGMNFITHKTTTAYQMVTASNDGTGAMAGITVSGTGPLALTVAWGVAETTQLVTGAGFVSRLQ